MRAANVGDEILLNYVGHLHNDSNLENLSFVTILKSSTLGCQQHRDTIMFMTTWCWQLKVSDNFWIFGINVGQHNVRVALMLVTDVGDQICWWKDWDVGHRFRMLTTDLIHWRNQQNNENSRQHNITVTSCSTFNTKKSSPTYFTNIDVAQHHCSLEGELFKVTKIEKLWNWILINSKL